MKRNNSFENTCHYTLALRACIGINYSANSSLDFNPFDGRFHLMYECGGKIPHTCGIARKIRLTDDGTDLMMSPIDALTTLETDVFIDKTNPRIEIDIEEADI